MKINWKIRLKNKGTLTAIVSGMISLVYQILGIVGVTPPVNQSNVAEAAVVLINMLLLAGVVIDPTTKGISDSDMAMMYTCPRCDLESAEDDYDDYDEMCIRDRALYVPLSMKIMNIVLPHTTVHAYLQMSLNIYVSPVENFC